MRRPLVALVAAVTIGVAGVSGCSGSQRASCDELRAELGSLDSTATAAWDDITVLRDEVDRDLQLQREIENRCGPTD